MNKTERDGFRKFAAQLQNGSGSGCLFQPATDAYSYILTAKHVVEMIDPVWIIQEHADNGNLVQIPAEKVYKHDTEDAAIVKIRKIEGLTGLKPAQLPLDEYGYFLPGYPDCRKGKSDPYRLDEVTIIDTKEGSGYIEIKIHDRPLHSEVVGMSGGGIIKKINSNKYLLAGIQKEMVEEEEKELLGRTWIIPISVFDEMIGANQDLAPLLASSSSLFNELGSLMWIRDLFSEGQVAPIHCQEAIYLLEQLLKSLDDSREFATNSPYEKEALIEELLQNMYNYCPKSYDPKKKVIKDAIQEDISQLLDLYKT